MEKLKLKYLSDLGYSIIPCNSDKTPIGSWKKYQTTARSKDEIESLDSPLYGFVTGYNNLEVLDIDLKVVTGTKDKIDLWDEFLKFIKDNILDFDEKFVIVKTKNAGYHILYKCNFIEGNKKIAKLKDTTEALFETRGIGGMVIMYENFVSKLDSYSQIQEITEEDRDILLTSARMYNYIEEVTIEPKKEKTEFATGQITPWQDYNDKTNILDLVQSDFTIVANHNKRYVIKRHGALSPHSGYIFKDSGCMYLFSTGTIYPHEKLITPFIAFTYKYYNGNFSDASKELYKLGYGSRIEKIIKEKEKSLPNNENEITNYLINENDLVFPIDIFPKPMQNYIIECNSKLDSNIDYMGCSLLWLISICIGNSIEMEVKRGWTENVSLWISLVGKAGIGKTPSINNILFPLLKINQREIKKYYKELEVWQQYNALDKKEKKEVPYIEKPIKTQFIANDITLEALVDLHQESDNAVGIFKDELAGWLKDMNKYRAGSDLEFWLSVWSGKAVNLNRLTRVGSYVDKPFVPVLGGIQPNILSHFYTEENKDNGFMDRMLLSFPDAKIETYNENELSYDVLDWYKENIIAFFDKLKYVIQRDNENNIIPMTAKFSDEARFEWIRIFNEITTYQNSDEENEYLKSMYPKQKSYIPRFALLIHAFDENFSAGGDVLEVSKESVLKAEKLSKYFVATAKKLKVNTATVINLKTTSKAGKNNFEKLKLIYEENPDFNRSQTAEILGISRQQVNRLLKQIEGK